MLVLLLDPYHLGDPLFLPGFARDVMARGAGLVIVHGTGERGERALESLGVTPSRVGGVWEATTTEQQEVLERTGRDLNREIAHELNEAGVATIRVLGADRGLLKRGADGRLGVGRVGWLEEVVQKGVVPVVAAFVGADVLHEVRTATAAAVLGEALRASVGLLATSRLPSDVPVSADELRALLPPEAEVDAVIEAGGSVRVMDRAALRGSGAGAEISKGTTPGQTALSEPSGGGAA